MKIGKRFIVKTLSLFAVACALVAVLSSFGFYGAKVYAETYSGEVLNIAVIVNFADGESVADEDVNRLNDLYNTEEYGVKKYFETVSRNKLSVTTVFPESKEGKSFVTVSKTEEYYRPKYEWNGSKYVTTENAQGYDNRYYDDFGNAVSPSEAGAKQHVDGYAREQTLVREVLANMRIPTGNYDADADKDGKTDSISLIINCSALTNDDWGMILWPHMSGLCNAERSIKNAYYIPAGFDLSGVTAKYPVVLNKEADTYDVLSLRELITSTDGRGNPGTLCHELMHTLGALDYYGYFDQSFEYLGETDVMASTFKVPQYPTTYVRQKLGWVGEKNVMKITKSGTYTLYPTTYEKDTVALKIDTKGDGNEYFMIEARSNEGVFDGGLAESGLLIYRVNEKDGYRNATGDVGDRYYGNMYCDYEKDGSANVYAFRFGGGSKVTDNLKTSANPLEPRERKSLCLLNLSKIKVYSLALKETIDKSVFGSESGTENAISYSDGTNSGIVVKVISENEDGSYTFRVKIPGSEGDAELKPDVGEPYVYYVKDGKVGVRFVAEDFGNKAELLASSAELNEEEFEEKSGKTVIDLTLPYKKYGVTLTGLGKSGKRYICYKVTYGGIYSSYGCIEVDMSVEKDDGTALGFGKITLVEPPTFKDGKISLNTDADGYIVVAKVDGKAKMTANEVMENCSDYEYFDSGLGEYAVSYDKSEIRVFVVTKDGVSDVYSFGSGGNATASGEKRGCFGYAPSVAFGTAVIVAVVVLSKRKRR